MDARAEGAGPPVRSASTRAVAGGGTVFAILFATSAAHGLNDTMQSLLPAIYPVLRTTFSLDYGQIGFLTLAFQLTASLLQPLSDSPPTSGHAPIRCRSRWRRRSSGWCCSPRRRATRCFWWPPPPWGSARQSFIQRPRVSRAWHRAAGMAWRSRCSRWAATSARPPARCWRRSSSCRTGREASPGSRCWRSPE